MDFSFSIWASSLPVSVCCASVFETVQLRLGLEPTVFEFEVTHLVLGLLKLRFFMYHCRKNSVRDKVIGKKWTYLERNTLHRVWAISVDERP